MFENRHEPLLSRSKFAVRMVTFIVGGLLVDVLMVIIGSVFYCWFEGWGWLDSAVTAAMIMTSNGPVNELKTSAGKTFAIIDAIIGGIVFGAVIGAVLSPVFHRALHAFHLAVPGGKSDEDAENSGDYTT
jgi:hypothetical protein